MHEAHGKPKILIADDIEMVLKLEEILLKRTGCEVVKAKDGSEALKIIKDEKPVVAVLDLIMPQMNGDVVCRMVKSNPDLKDTTIIMVTAKGTEEERSKKAGCDYFLTKPIRHNQLLDLVRKVLKEKGILKK